MSDVEYIDNESLNGRTFYRAEASPAVANKGSFIQIYNPPGSSVLTYFDQVYLFGGQPVSSEYGLTYYSTTLDNPAVGGELRGHFWPTRYGAEQSKTRLYVGNYPSELGRIDYFFQVAPNDAEPKDHKFPSPIILGEGVGICLWQPCHGFEGKAGIWLREKPAS